MAQIMDLIGNTPLLELSQIFHKPGVRVMAKAEWANPGGSVKDRPARAMLLAGEQSGELTRARSILDATSGNTGIAYAMIGAARGYRVTLCLSANASQERQNILRAYGAQLILTDPQEATDGAIREARRLVAECPTEFFYPDQYSNDFNWKAHYETTGVEILEQTGGRITHFVAGVGTSGTLMGVGRRLREDAPEVTLISMQPDIAFHGLEGLKHMESAMVPAIYDADLADQNLEVATEDAHAMAIRLARDEGWFVGPSAAANVVAAVRVAEQIAEGVVVTVLCDAGYKYVGDDWWRNGC